MKSFLVIVATITAVIAGSSSLALAGLGESTLLITVINDVNEDGVRDEGEPGLASWNILLVCGDAIEFSGQTGADGTLVYSSFRGSACVNLSVAFGWFATSPTSVVVQANPGEDAEALFLVRHVGDQVKYFSGLFIVHGRPGPPDTPLVALVDGTDCGDLVIRHGFPGLTEYEAYVFSDSERSGCATPGEAVTFRASGVDAGSGVFEAGQRQDLDLIVGAPPMYVTYYSYYAPPLNGGVTAFMDSRICGEGYPVKGGGLFPPNSQTLLVRSAETSEGCGAPGQVVDLKVDDEIVGQVLWEEGRVYKSDLQHLGDPNCDTHPDSEDAALILQYVAGFVSDLACEFRRHASRLDAADVNRDGRTNAVDAALVLQRSALLISQF